jgi:vitamin B12 transporter
MAGERGCSWRIGSDMQYTGERKDGDERLGSYAVFNFNLRYQATRDVSLFGRIENAFNREYQTAYGYDMPSRGIFAGVNWKL